jgi:hypothetical protein
MGSIITIHNKKIIEEKYSIKYEIENQKVDYSIKYSDEVLVLNDPDFIHTDIMFDIYKKSVQIRVNKIRARKQCIYDIDDLRHIGRDIYNDYFYDTHYKKDIDLSRLNRSDFVFGQKLIYTEIYITNKKTNFELYMLYFIDKICFFIFVLSEDEYRLYFKEYLFERRSSSISKKDIESVILLSFGKYYMYCNEFHPIPLEEVREEHYLYSIKRDISNKFKIVDLMDIDGLKRSCCDEPNSFNDNILINNPLIEFHFLIEKQIRKILKL